MRLQIVDSETGEVIFLPRSNATLEADLLSLFDPVHPRWRPIARRRFRYFSREVRRVSAELRQATARA